jgi:N-acetylmuramoyl-L-alanine amidase
MLTVMMVGCESCNITPRGADTSPGQSPGEPGTVVMIDGRPVRLVVPMTLDNSEAPIGPFDPALDGTPDNAPEPPAQPLRPVKVVVVDAGHGGDNAGAVADGVAEKDINLDIAQRLAEALRKLGIRVILTRNEDVFLTLDERAEIANAARADLFLCIHANAAANTEASGIEIYFPAMIFKHGSVEYDDAARAEEMNGKRLPEDALTDDGDSEGAMTANKLAFARDLGRTLGHEIERAIIDTCHATSRGVKPQTFEVLRCTSVPAVLIEVGFLTNDAERAKLTDAQYRQSLAEAIAEAVRSYSKMSEPAR